MARPLKILIAEDNPDDAELALTELRRAGFEPQWERVETEKDFLARLDGSLDLVLSDYQMPTFNGFQALELVKKSGLEVPFILVSGTIGEDVAVAAMKLGASDYLLKDRLARLGAAVTHALDEGRLRRERLQAAGALRLAHAQVGQLLDQSPAVLYVWKLADRATIPYLISENITALLGFAVAETMHADWWLGQLHPDDLDRGTDSVAETLRAGSSLTEYRLRHKQGHYRWVDDARRVVKDAAGKPIELIGVWTDITERKRAGEVVQFASERAAWARRRRVRIELAVLFGATGLTYLLAARFDWFEWVTSWFLGHAVAQMDEMILATVFVAVGLGIFAFRRWRETELAMTNHQEIQATLGLLHEEMDRRIQQRTAQLRNANQALVTEIEGHKQTETVLQESNRRFHDVLENVELIAMTLDREGRVTFCNDYLLDLTGWRRDEVLGHDWCLRFAPPGEAEVRRLLITKMETGEVPPHHENPIQTRTGELREIVWSTTMLRDAEGEVIGVASIGEDITDRNRAGRILRESEERFRQLAENIHEVFWITDLAKNEVLYVSPPYEMVWGRTCASLYASYQTWLDSIHPDDRERVAEARRTKQAPGTYDEEYRIIRPDGAERWIRDRAFPVKSASGTVTRCVGVAEDITESKKLQEQFFRAQRMEAIGTLAGGIAHDLNNILAPVLMAPALLREQVTSDKSRRLLDIIEQAAQRGSNIVRQLLTFSRGTGGERASVQLSVLLEEMAGIMRETFPRDIAIDVDAARHLRTVLGDATQLHQVLLNLCVNARDAMPEGGRISLSARNVELTAGDVIQYAPAKPGPYVLLKAVDTGQGISPEIIDRIFDPFFTTKPPSKGTGLGLSTVLGIVRSHGGFTTVTSTLGRGTTFSIYLPADVSASVSLQEDDAEALLRGRGELILVVDDEEPIRAATSLTLESHGYQVLTANDGAEALATFVTNRGSVRLVLTDLMMPVMGGVSLIRALHALEPTVRVLATSGLADQENSAKLEEVGVDGTIAKPCDPRELLKTIRQLLSTERTRPSGKSSRIPLSPAAA